MVIIMLAKIRNYIMDEEFKITVFENKIDIENYVEIDHFDDKKITINYDKGKVIINGNELVIEKLLDDEILISGLIVKIEFINEK